MVMLNNKEFNTPEQAGRLKELGLFGDSEFVWVSHLFGKKFRDLATTRTGFDQIVIGPALTCSEWGIELAGIKCKNMDEIQDVHCDVLESWYDCREISEPQARCAAFLSNYAGKK